MALPVAANSRRRPGLQAMTLPQNRHARPESPGCYLYKNAQGKVIYVGKAINLRRAFSGTRSVRIHLQELHFSQPDRPF